MKSLHAKRSSSKPTSFITETPSLGTVTIISDVDLPGDTPRTFPVTVDVALTDGQSATDASLCWLLTPWRGILCSQLYINIYDVMVWVTFNEH